MGSSEVERPKLLLVENEPHAAKALRSAAEAVGFDPCAASSLREARACLEREDFAAGIIEAVLPDGSGLELVQQLRDRSVGLPVLVLSSALSVEVVNRAHLLRASCVFKPDIVSNVRIFLQRAMASTGDAAQRTMAAAREVSLTFELTAREHQVLELAALGVPRERLADELGVSENTMKTLVRRMLAKCRETRVESAVRAVLDEVVYLACTGEPI